MAEERERLLPPTTLQPFRTAAVSYPYIHGDGRRPMVQGMDFSGLKKRSQSRLSWIRVDATTGASEEIEVDKFTMMSRCDLPAHDLRLLDPLFVYPSTILGRERAIVVNLEQIRCIITADEVLLLNSLDSTVFLYVTELQSRLAAVRKVNAFAVDESSPDYLPFEFLALELVLESACTYLDKQATELESEAYPFLEDLAGKLNLKNLELVRRLKSRLVALTQRVQKVRDEVEYLMDDDKDMAELYLTEKKRRAESSFFGDKSIPDTEPSRARGWASSPVSPISSMPESHKLEKMSSLNRSRQESVHSSQSSTQHIAGLEMLLETYFVVIDNTLNNLMSLKEYIDDTEDLINIQLDNVRNQLIQFELLLTTATFAVTIFGVVAGVFGMNFAFPLFDQAGAFQWILLIAGAVCILIFCALLWYFKHRRFIPLQ